MRVIMGRKLAILAWRNSPREQCVRFWQHMRSSRTRSAITRSGATPSSSQKWPKCFAFTARSRCGARPPRSAMTRAKSSSSPMMRSPVFRRSAILPPVPGTHPTTQRDHEYQRHGTVTLMAGIDLLTGTVHALVKDRHRSREFIEFLKIRDTAYPAATAINIILDNHSAHISRETKTWLKAQPDGRFAFVFTPKHGSWLNLVEGFSPKQRAPCSATSVSVRHM